MKSLIWKSSLKFMSRLFIALAVAGSINPVPATASAWQRYGRRSARSSQRHSASSKAPVVSMQVNNHRNGTASLIFKFLKVPANFQVDKIVLQVRQTKPVSPVQGSPSEQVKAAYYTAQVSNTTFDQRDPTITADIRLYHNPREPYALAIVCLWYSRPQSHIEFKVRPRYLDAEGEEISIPTKPEETIVVLENRPTVSPVDLRAEPSGSATEPTCEDRNAGKGD